LAVDRERLVAELRASRERLRASRARLVHTADRERRRIARDLHDGLQARLVVLAMRADRLRGDPAASAETRAEAERLHAELDAAIGELRELVHGVLPASLAERGLSAAVRELADGLPLRAELDLDLDGRRLPAAIESAAYFVVAEALSNAVKHARADRLSVRVGERGGRLLLEVADDGIGGADLAGAGLRGIADRIEALDGRLRVDSPVGAGTRVVAELPCGS
jgi:signal transduction histidine kinase